MDNRTLAILSLAFKTSMIAVPVFLFELVIFQYMDGSLSYKIVLGGIVLLLFPFILNKRASDWSALILQHFESNRIVHDSDIQALEDLYNRIYEYLDIDLKEQFRKLVETEITPDKVYFWLAAEKNIQPGAEWDEMLAEFMLYHDGADDPVPSWETIQEAEKCPNGFVYAMNLPKTKKSGTSEIILGSWKVNSKGKIIGIFIPRRTKSKY